MFILTNWEQLTKNSLCNQSHSSSEIDSNSRQFIDSHDEGSKSNDCSVEDDKISFEKHLFCGDFFYF